MPLEIVPRCTFTLWDLLIALPTTGPHLNLSYSKLSQKFVDWRRAPSSFTYWAVTCRRHWRTLPLLIWCLRALFLTSTLSSRVWILRLSHRCLGRECSKRSLNPWPEHFRQSHSGAGWAVTTSRMTCICCWPKTHRILLAN